MTELVINNVIIHGLNKEKDEPVKETDWGSVLDSHDQGVVQLLDAILEVYGKKHNRIQYGTFCDQNLRGEFANNFQNYYELESSTTDQDFKELSVIAVNELIKTAHITPAATGGYIVFYDYLSGGARFYLIAMVKQRPGLRINRKMVPELVTQVETNKLHQAARINFDRFYEYSTANNDEKQQISYLNFLSPSARAGASAYFISALDCVQGAATSRATSTVIKEAINIYNSDDDLKPYCHDMKMDLVGFLQKKGKDKDTVNLDEVAEVFRKHLPVSKSDTADDITQSYISTLNSEENTIPFHFNVNSSTLGQFSRVFAKTNNWSFNIDYSVLGDDSSASVFYDRESGTITFTELPDDVKKKIVSDLDARSK